MLILPWRFAHEVYVLKPDQINVDQHAPQINPWTALQNHHDLKLFLLMGGVVLLFSAAAIFLKSWHLFQRTGQRINQATAVAPDIIRVSLGLSLLFSAHFHSVFGPELPTTLFTGNAYIQPFFYVTGLALVLGLASQFFGALVGLFWLVTFIDHGWYMLNYINYFGEAVALVLIGRQNFSLDRVIFKKSPSDASRQRWAMPIARWLLAVSILYAAINVKFVTPALSVDVVNKYHLTNYFHFDPLFVVLLAGLVECGIGLLYLFGLLQRLNSIIFIGFITASLIFFKEAVWPHYILIGLAVGIFLHKPDDFALDKRLFHRRK